MSNNNFNKEFVTIVDTVMRDGNSPTTKTLSHYRLGLAKTLISSRVNIIEVGFPSGKEHDQTTYVIALKASDRAGVIGEVFALLSQSAFIVGEGRNGHVINPYREPWKNRNRGKKDKWK